MVRILCEWLEMSEDFKQLLKGLNLQLVAVLLRKYFCSTFSTFQSLLRNKRFWNCEELLVIFEDFTLIAVVNAYCRRQSVLQVSNLDCVVKIWCQLRFLDHMVNKRKEHLNFVVFPCRLV